MLEIYPAKRNRRMDSVAAVVESIPPLEDVMSRVAYWDGRNDTGERVGSGVYFYCLRAGDYSDIRKLVILK